MEHQVFGKDAAGLAKWHFSIHGENNNPYKPFSDEWKVYEQTYDMLELAEDNYYGEGSYEMP